jgi:hypothetical protein
LKAVDLPVVLAENEVVNGIIIGVLMFASSIGSHPDVARKPACNASIRGQFWPQAANSNAKAATELSHCGALEMCTTTTWKYKWRAVTVNIRQLGKTPQQPTAGCLAVMTEFREKGQ